MEQKAYCELRVNVWDGTLSRARAVELHARTKCDIAFSSEGTLSSARNVFGQCIEQRAHAELRTNVWDDALNSDSTLISL